MSRTTYSARITGPLHYTTSSGKQADVPLGPCLIEQVDGQGSTSSGGPSGEKSAELAFKELEAAEECGNLEWGTRGPRCPSVRCRPFGTW